MRYEEFNRDGLVGYFFDLKSEKGRSENTKLKKWILRYMEDHGQDPQLQDIARLINMYNDPMESGQFAYYYNLIQPIFARLGPQPQWDFIDTRIAAIGILHAPFTGLEQTITRLIHNIHRFRDKKDYNKILSQAYMHIVHRLVKAKYVDLPTLGEGMSPTLDELIPLIRKYSNDGFAFVRKYGTTADSLVMEIRSAIFFEHYPQARTLLARLKRESGKASQYNNTMQEISDYNIFEDEEMGRFRIDVSIGKRLRLARKDRYLSLTDFAKLVNIKGLTLHGVEHGKISLSPYNMRKIADATGISPNSLVLESGPAHHASPEAKVIHSLTSKLSGLNLTELQSTEVFVNMIFNKKKQDIGKLY